MEFRTLIKIWIISLFIIAIDVLFHDKNVYATLSYSLIKRILGVLANALLLSCLIWFVFTYCVKLMTSLSSYTVRSWHFLNARIRQYLPAMFLPTPFYQHEEAFIDAIQPFPQSPRSYGDHNVPIIETETPSPAMDQVNLQVHHHVVHGIRTTPYRRRIPRMPVCTLNSSPSETSSVRRRIILLENLEAQMRNTSLHPGRCLLQDNPPSANGRIEICEETQKFTAVVKTESRTNVYSSDDTLVLHQFPRSLTKPCLFPPGLHLETYVRLIEIPCDVVFDCTILSGPWITYEGRKVRGVKKCMEFLKANFSDKTMLFTVHGERSASAWSVSLLIEHLDWVLQWWRWEFESASEFAQNQPQWQKLIKNSSASIADIRSCLRSRGFNHLTRKDGFNLIAKDLSSLSVIIQNSGNCFLLGPSPTETDCQAFSVLSQVVWGNESFRLKIHQDFPVISDYCCRLRSMLWPDWTEQLATSLHENSTSHVCKIYANNDNTLDRGDESEKPVEQCKSIPSSSSPVNREFRNSYYHLTPGGVASTSDATKPATRKSIETFNKTEDPEAEFLFLCTKCPVRSEVILHDPQTATSSPNRYRITEDDDDAHSPYTQPEAHLLYTSQEEYFDDNLEDIS